MIIRRKGGLIEFIPSPREKREGLIRDHVLGLLENLHRRVERLERETGLPVEETEDFAALFRRIQTDETRNMKLHADFMTSSSVDT